MTELDEATGALVKVFAGPRFGFDDPYGISSNGSVAWVTNYLGQFVTGIPAA